MRSQRPATWNTCAQRRAPQTAGPETPSALHLRSLEVIRGHQRSSEVVRGHQRSSEVIRGHQRPSAPHQRRLPASAGRASRQPPTNSHERKWHTAGQCCRVVWCSPVTGRRQGSSVGHQRVIKGSSVVISGSSRGHQWSSRGHQGVISGHQGVIKGSSAVIKESSRGTQWQSVRITCRSGPRGCRDVINGNQVHSVAISAYHLPRGT